MIKRSLSILFFAVIAVMTAVSYIPSSYTVTANAAVPKTKPARVETIDESRVASKESATSNELPEHAADTSARTVPFYSQFADISAPEWRKIGCGIASLAMLVDFYQPAVSVDELLNEGIQNGAYVYDAGWSHAGLIALAEDHGLTGEARYLTDLNMTAAFADLKAAIEKGPVMASVHYTFEPTNPIPHLVVVTDIDDEGVHYNDPAEKSGGGVITPEKFQNSWKKRYIEIRPAT